MAVGVCEAVEPEEPAPPWGGMEQEFGHCVDGGVGPADVLFLHQEAGVVVVDCEVVTEGDCVEECGAGFPSCYLVGAPWGVEWAQDPVELSEHDGEFFGCDDDEFFFPSLQISAALLCG